MVASRRFSRYLSIGSEEGRGNAARSRQAPPLGASAGRAPGGAWLGGYFFSTFQRKVTGELMTPERLERYAVGMMNCAVGT